MAKIRNITDKNWRIFEKNKKEQTSNEYFEYLLCNQVSDDLLQAVKSDLTRCINEFGDLSERFKKVKLENKELKKEIKRLKQEVIDAITIEE